MLVTSSHACLAHHERHSFEVDMTEEEFDKATREWKGGKFIQDAFPKLDANQREMILTGTCQTAWDELFPDEDDDLLGEDVE